ncbi:N-acetylglucosamine-6-phosphate deacetylase [Bacillus sp. FJAT-27225]|uniref:N-acetylglucosamine-6-phosphate deacetylase n=1 Tax=Bacillus sp. FJAT-27225 TaxID=1743144 RepID=UPI00080C222D|nr:N-acetylglucosamine-6-phosphate deacetylase [Bacillus sp. FJAT-27225]OCA85866.1 N-acetylglucosamine-6-phosphate deacetylase [Bacillus sp. FJAT-27225]
MGRNHFYLAGTVVTDKSIFENMIIEIRDGKIIYAGNNHETIREDLPCYQAAGWICPGFIDSHIHGVNGFDFMDGTKEGFNCIREGLPQFGVTSFLATSRAAPLEDIKTFLLLGKQAVQEQSGAECLGVHLEGPWINPKYQGAQKAEYMLNPVLKDAESILNFAEGTIRIVTLAPELPNSLEVIKLLHKNNVAVSAGHTDASYEEIEKAVRSGLSRITHFFNAMAPISHRKITVSFAALYLNSLHCELIADGFHVHPKMIEWLFRLKGADHLTLISDCTGTNQLPDGRHLIGGKTVFKQDGKVTLENGSLAGSSLTLNRAVQYAVRNCAIPLEDAVHMASYNPAQVCGVANRKGKIAAGYDADLVILTDDLEVETTIVGGDVIFQRK